MNQDKLWTRIAMLTLTLATGATQISCDSTANKDINTLTSDQDEIATPSSTVNIASKRTVGDIADQTEKDILYLTQLGLMRGHLYVGKELYNSGNIEHAKMHLKHPQSELYAEMVPAFAERGSDGFAEELTILFSAVSEDLGKVAVSAAYDRLISSITASENLVKAINRGPAQNLKLASNLVKVAAEEYEIAVVDGRMMNAHEYQDAFGFTTVASLIVSSIVSDDDAVIEVRTEAIRSLKTLEPNWPSLIPPKTLSTNSESLHAVAAEIQILSLGGY